MKKKVVVILFFMLMYIMSSGARPLNILFVVGHFPAPSQTFILNIITGLIDRGHNVSIFSFHKDSLVDMHPHIEKYNLLKHVTYTKFPENLSKCDIVFCQFGYLGQKIFQMRHISKWLKKRKVVVCLRGSDLSAHIQHDPIRYQQLFKKAHLFLPVCNYFRKKLIKLGCKSSKISVHHSAIDCSEFFFSTRSKPAYNKINLVSVSRLVKKKGIDDAIKAVAELVSKYPRIHYFIVGDGPERNYLNLLIDQLSLQDHVTLCGWKSQEEVVSILDNSHIFVLPSKTADDGNEEGIPNALKEAMAMGLMSIGTWHAGTPELIDDRKSGFLVPERSSVQLAQTIEYIIEHPEIWEPISLAARQKIEDEFETKQCIEQLEHIFYQLLGHNGAHN